MLNQCHTIKQVGKYNLEKVIGMGQFGVTYQASLKESIKQQYTIEIISKEILSNIKLNQTFTQELHFMETISHQNVMRLIDYFESESNCYVVMDLCKGDLEHETFTHFKYDENQQKYTMPESLAVSYLLQIMSGLSELHKNFIVHRDLKPTNIFINDKNVIKITCLSFIMKSDKENTLGIQAGTPIIMAPEIMEQENYGINVDVWSLGVLYYFLLFGQYPFISQNSSEYIQKIKNKQIAFTVNFVKCSKESQDFITNCLIYEPAQRILWKDLYWHQLLQKYISQNELIKQSALYYASQEFNSIADLNIFILNQKAEQNIKYINSIIIRNSNANSFCQEILDINKKQDEQDNNFTQLLKVYEFELEKYQQFGKVIYQGLKIWDNQKNLTIEKVCLCVLCKKQQILLKTLFESLLQKQNIFNFNNFIEFLQSQKCKELQKDLSDMVVSIQYFMQCKLQKEAESYVNSFLKQELKLSPRYSQIMQKYNCISQEQQDLKNFQLYFMQTVQILYEIALANLRNTKNLNLALFCKDLLDCALLEDFNQSLNMYIANEFSFQQYNKANKQLSYEQLLEICQQKDKILQKELSKFQ